MSFFENPRKPVGFSGKIMVAMMNFGHSAMAAWGLHFLQPASDAMVLDCGCGGGANIKTLLKLCPKGTDAWTIPGTEDLKPYITAKNKQKKWLFGTVGMAVIAMVLAAMMTIFTH